MSASSLMMVPDRAQATLQLVALAFARAAVACPSDRRARQRGSSCRCALGGRSPPGWGGGRRPPGTGGLRLRGPGWARAGATERLRRGGRDPGPRLSAGLGAAAGRPGRADGPGGPGRTRTNGGRRRRLGPVRSRRVPRRSRAPAAELLPRGRRPGGAALDGERPVLLEGRGVAHPVQGRPWIVCTPTIWPRVAAGRLRADGGGGRQDLGGPGGPALEVAVLAAEGDGRLAWAIRADAVGPVQLGLLERRPPDEHAACGQWDAVPGVHAHDGWRRVRSRVSGPGVAIQGVALGWGRVLVRVRSPTGVRRMGLTAVGARPAAGRAAVPAPAMGRARPGPRRQLQVARRPSAGRRASCTGRPCPRWARLGAGPDGARREGPH